MDMTRIPDGLKDYLYELRTNGCTTKAEIEKKTSFIACLDRLRRESAELVSSEIDLRTHSVMLLARLRQFQLGQSSDVPTRLDAEISQELRLNLLDSVIAIKKVVKALRKIDPRCPKKWPSVEKSLKAVTALLRRVEELERDVIDCWDGLVPEE